MGVAAVAPVAPHHVIRLQRTPEHADQQVGHGGANDEDVPELESQSGGGQDGDGDEQIGRDDADAVRDAQDGGSEVDL